MSDKEYTPPKRVMVWLIQDEKGVWLPKRCRREDEPNVWRGSTLSERDRFEVYELVGESDE